MGQEFVIKSQAIEDKVNQLLPSQGGFQAGVDFSASTMVVPIVDLTETAEGSSLRQDLQRSLSLTSVTAFAVENTTTTLINTTGYFRVFGTQALMTNTQNFSHIGKFELTDGTTTKVIYQNTLFTDTPQKDFLMSYDFMVLLQAGESLQATTNKADNILQGVTRQIATLTGSLVNP